MNDKLTDIEEEILSILHQKDILLEDIGDLADDNDFLIFLDDFLYPNQHIKR